MKIWGFAAVAALSGLGCSQHTMVANHIRDSWVVAKEYEQNGYHYYIAQESYRIIKFVQVETAPAYPVYQVDTLTRTCVWESVPVDCEKLKGDPDLAGYIDWSPAP